jgi:hypothetical protein
MRKANKATLKYLTLFIILGFILAAMGCMSPMAINNKMQSLDISKESIVLFSVRASNMLVPNNQLILQNIKAKETVSGKKFSFQVDDPINYGISSSPKFYDYLISLKLSPDKYTISQISGRGAINGVRGREFLGHFSVDLKIDFDVEPNTVLYLGHIEMINRQRKEGETRSGTLFPILDQTMGGFYTGTMDISISDSYDEDITIFKQNYPVLENCTVKKSIMEKMEIN